MKQVCTVITVTRGAFDFSQSKPSKVNINIITQPGSGFA